MADKEESCFGDTMRIVQLESERDEANAAKSRAHTFLRNTATELEEGVDPMVVADNIHEAMGEGRPNKTTEDEDDG